MEKEGPDKTAKIIPLNTSRRLHYPANRFPFIESRRSPNVINLALAARTKTPAEIRNEVSEDAEKIIDLAKYVRMPEENPNNEQK